MDVNIEARIRSRIEAVLINDARNYAELRMMAAQEEPMEDDAFEEERNLYQRIINSYRSAVSEVNSMLEENVGFLSGLCRIVETIKEKDNFREICAQIVDCVLQDLSAEYCSLIFYSRGERADEPLYLEGVRERQKFLFSHCHAALLGSPEFALAVTRLAQEATDCVNMGDVYREPRFNEVDFPSVVRSLVCLPVIVHETKVGALVLSHSLPRFFTNNHTRVLRILASTTAHLYLLTARHETRNEAPLSSTPESATQEDEETLSIVLLSFENEQAPMKSPANKEMIRSIRSTLCRTLEESDSILPYEDRELLVLLPGICESLLPMRASRLYDAFEQWKSSRGRAARGVHMNVGYATCQVGEDLIQTIDAASMMMLAEETQTEGLSQAVPDSPQH